MHPLSLGQSFHNAAGKVSWPGHSGYAEIAEDNGCRATKVPGMINDFASRFSDVRDFQDSVGALRLRRVKAAKVIDSDPMCGSVTPNGQGAFYLRKSITWLKKLFSWTTEQSFLASLALLSR